MTKAEKKEELRRIDERLYHIMNECAALRDDLEGIGRKGYENRMDTITGKVYDLIIKIETEI